MQRASIPSVSVIQSVSTIVVIYFLTIPTWFGASDDAWHSIEWCYQSSFGSTVARVGFAVASWQAFALFERSFEKAEGERNGIELERGSFGAGIFLKSRV